MKTILRILLVMLFLGMLLACGLLFLSLRTRIVETLPGNVSGYHNSGTPPRGGSCAQIGRVFEETPFHGWPVDFRPCDWGIISAYFCTPNYFPGYTHWGIDLASYWSPDGSETINGRDLLVTTDFGRVKQAIATVPPQYNFGMGNFVQIEAWVKNIETGAWLCTEDPNADYDAGHFEACWAAQSPLPTGCTGKAEADWQNGLLGVCYRRRVGCAEPPDPRVDEANGRLEDCWKPSGWKATYMHLMDITVEPGQWVFYGEVIGHVDNTGNSTGPHLHYQINAPAELGIGAIDPAPTFGCPAYDWQDGVSKGK